MVRNRLRNFDILPLDSASVRASVRACLDTGLLWTTLSHAEYYHVHVHCICARGAPTILYMQYTRLMTDPVKCLLIIVNVAVLVVKCCETRDC